MRYLKVFWREQKKHGKHDNNVADTTTKNKNRR